jgi:uncharacterized protein YoxC
MSGQYDGKVRIGTKIDDSDLAGDLEKLRSRLQSASAKLRDVMQGPVEAVRQIGQALQKANAILGQYIETASDANESNNKFKEVFKDQADQVDRWANRYFQAFGLAKTETKDFAATLQNTFVPMGFAREEAAKLSMGLVELAGDMGSFNNIARKDVIADFQSALVGNTETVRKYGIVITETTLAQKAISEGVSKTGKDLSEQEKIWLRYKVILDSTKDAQGDLARTSDSYANISQRLESAQKALFETIGNQLLPVATAMKQRLGDLFLMIAQNEKTPEVLFKIATGLGAATAGVAAFVLVSQGHAVVTALGKALLLVNDALFANPYALAGAALAALVVVIAGAAKAAEDHTEALKKQIEKSSESQKEVKALADEYQNLYDKVNPTATEQNRMAEIAKTLHDRFPDLTTDTINLAAANGTLATKATAAADAQARILAKPLYEKAEKDLVQATKEYANYKQILDEVGKLNPGQTYLEYTSLDKEKIQAIVNDAAARQKKAIDDIELYKSIAMGTYIPPSPLEPAKNPSPGGGGSTGSTTLPQGTRLKALDEEYKARIALAENTGEDVAAIEKEWYDKRLAMLGDFVVEDAKKGVKLEYSLKSSFAGYAEEGSDDLRQLGKEIDATRFKLEKYKDAAGDTMFTPLDYGAANAVWNGEAAPEPSAGSAQDWADDYLGKAAFQAIMQAVSEGLSASDTEEWVQEYLGKQAFETLQSSVGEALSASDAEEWVQTYLGDEAFRALQSAASDGLSAADTQAWVEDYLGDKAFKALQDAATDGLQAADVAEWSEEYLGKNVFEALMSAADEGLQSAAVQEWCDDYLGKGAFDALQAAAEEGLQAADVEEWAADYLGKQVFDAMSEAATLGLQEADVAEWVADYLNAKKLANALDAEDMKIQAAKVAAWIADYKKNHGTVAEGGDGWVAYDRYLEEMRKKTELAPWQQAGVVGKQGEDGTVSGGTEIGNLFAGLVDIGKAFADSIGGIVQAVTSLSSVQQILNPLTTIFSSMMEVIGPVINEVLGPIVGMFKMLGEALGQILAPAIQLLTPIIKLISEIFVFLYNSIIVPVGNAIIKAFNWIYNGITSVLNWIIRAINDALGWIGVHLNEIAQRGADEGTLTAITAQDMGGTEATDALKEQNDALKANRELWTLASKAADAYASVLTKVKAAASTFYESLQNVGADITSMLIDNLVNGFSEEDFLYAMEEYIRGAVIKAAVYTESLMASVAAIGQKISDAIANGATSDDFADLAAELRALWEAAVEKAGIVAGIIDQSLIGSYDVGSLSVPGDQYAKIHDSEMILPAGIASEARSAGIVIGPAENLGSIGAAGISRQQISLSIKMDGSITADGREIGRIAYEHFDKFAGSAYGG